MKYGDFNFGIPICALQPVFGLVVSFDVCPSSDQPSQVQHGGAALPCPHLQLLPQRFLGSSGQEAVCRGADLPLEAQDHQERLREAREQNESKGSDGTCGGAGGTLLGLAAWTLKTNMSH